MSKVNVELLIKRFSGRIFVVSAIPALFAMFWVSTETNAPFIFAAKYLSAPILLGCYVVAFKYMPKWRIGTSRIAVFLVPAFVAALILLLSQAYVIYLNMAWGRQEPVMISGTIVRVNISRANCVLKIEQSNGEAVKLGYPTNECSNLKVGDRFSTTMTRGGLGILYATGR